MPSNEYLVTNAELTATANSIREKLGSQAAIRWASGTGFKSSVDDIQTGGGGSGADTSKPVKFYDYDGTLVYSYTPQEFAALSVMPDNPTHAGLTSQGWNWSLADAKTYVANYGKLDIGQMYATDDGKTRIHIRLGEGRLDPYLGLAVNGSADIDWGDGTAHSTLTGSSTSTVVYAGHSYASAGEYTIAIDITGTAAISGTGNGSKLLRKTNSGNSGNDDIVYENAIVNIFIGSHLSISTYAFSNCYSLTSITIPSGITSISTYAFNNCYGISFVKFLKDTPPTCSSRSTWTSIPTDCQVIYPYASTVAYKSATNYPSTSTYLYLGFYAGTAGEALPSTVTDGTTTYNLTWYANTKDAVAQTNPITTMQGTEVYCRSVLAE